VWQHNPGQRGKYYWQIWLKIKLQIWVTVTLLSQMWRISKAEVPYFELFLGSNADR
jgi:hypothetical protein